MTVIETTVYESPIGPLTLLAEPGGLCGIRFDGRPGGVGGGEILPEARAQLDEYFAGERRAFDLPVVLRGSEFQLAVWDVLRTIPYGETITYGEVTCRIGRPLEEARAVGAAIGRTPVPIVVGCHRVVGADGSLTGYGGGLHRKRALLDLESPVMSLL